MNKKLHQKAVEARQSSYSPYSRYQIGAALLTSSGKIYSGCNVENASYGATVCAERVAIWKAVSEEKLKIKEICVVSDSNKPWSPCGMCRQVIAEFASEDTLVHIANLKKIVKSIKFSQLFPFSFDKKDLG